MRDDDRTKKIAKKFLRKPRNDRETNIKSDGAHLMMGSSEYREFVLDNKGYDEFEQRDVKLEQRGAKKIKDIKKEDEFHKERQETLANDVMTKQLQRYNRDKMRLSDTKRIVSNQIIKSAQAEAIVEMGVKRAQITEDTKDDKFAKRRLPELVLKDVYNEGESKDDFYPGQKLLDKYM